MTIFTNGLKTAVLLGLMIGLCMGVGSFWHQQGLIIGFVIGGSGALISYFFSDKIALASVGAREIAPEEQPQLHDLVATLAERAGVPTPRLYWSPEQAPNAFATGRNPKHGVICVTDGLLKMMDQRELAGVLGHEMSHIKHRDILISTLAAVFGGVISHLAWWGMWGMGDRRDRDSGNPLIAIAVMLLAPMAAGLIQMAVSRSREYAADARGAQIAGGPEGLISALRKLDMANRQIPMAVSPGISHMFIIKPLSPMAQGMTELFMTHPATEKRIAKLIEQLGAANPYSQMA